MSDMFDSVEVGFLLHRRLLRWNILTICCHSRHGCCQLGSFESRRVHAFKYVSWRGILLFRFVLQLEAGHLVLE